MSKLYASVLHIHCYLYKMRATTECVIFFVLYTGVLLHTPFVRGGTTTQKSTNNTATATTPQRRRKRTQRVERLPVATTNCQLVSAAACRSVRTHVTMTTTTAGNYIKQSKVALQSRARAVRVALLTLNRFLCFALRVYKCAYLYVKFVGVAEKNNCSINTHEQLNVIN